MLGDVHCNALLEVDCSQSARLSRSCSVSMMCVQNDHEIYVVSAE